MSRVPQHLIRPVEVPTEAISLVGDIPEGWIPTASSWVQALRYDRAARTFDLMTREGKIYTDWPNGPGCSPELFREILAAPSKGQALHRHFPKSPRR